MKNTLLLSLFLATLSLPTEANPTSLLVTSPARGDEVTFRVTQGKEATLLHELKQEVLSENANRTLFNLRFTLSAPGKEPEVSTEQVPLDSLVSSEIVDGILKNCKELDGKLEKLKVAGAVLDACKMTYSEEGLRQTTWFAAVPFGVAKTYEEREIAADDEDQTTETETMELIQFRFGSL